MAISNLPKWIGFTLFVSLLAIQPANLQAASVAYTWTGKIKKNSSYPGDPWEIEDGKPFQATLYVNSDETPIFSFRSNAAFLLHRGLFKIPGKNAIFNAEAFTEIANGPPFIWFREESTYDSIQANFALECMDTIRMFGLRLTLPRNAFQLSNANSSPPIFEPFDLSNRSAIGFGNENYYFSSLEGGLLMAKIVPEPNILRLAGEVLLACLLSRNRLVTIWRNIG